MKIYEHQEEMNENMHVINLLWYWNGIERWPSSKSSQIFLEQASSGRPMTEFPHRKVTQPVMSVINDCVSIIVSLSTSLLPMILALLRIICYFLPLLLNLCSLTIFIQSFILHPGPFEQVMYATWMGWHLSFS